MKKRLTLCMLLASAMSLLVALPTAASGSTESVLKAKILSLSNLPTGWSTDTTATQSGDVGCLAGLKENHNETKVKVEYEDGQFPELEELLTAGPAAGSAYRSLEKSLNHCTSYSFSSGGTKATVTVGALSFPSVGNQSAAYALQISAEGENAESDLVMFRVGKIYGAVEYADLGTPDPDQAQAFITEAVDKVEGKTVTIPTTF